MGQRGSLRGIRKHKNENTERNEHTSYPHVWGGSRAGREIHTLTSAAKKSTILRWEMEAPIVRSQEIKSKTNLTQEEGRK